MKRKAIALANQCRDLMQENARLRIHIDLMADAGDDLARVVTQFRSGPRGNHVKDAFLVWLRWNQIKNNNKS